MNPTTPITTLLRSKLNLRSISISSTRPRSLRNPPFPLSAKTPVSFTPYRSASTVTSSSTGSGSGSGNGSSSGSGAKRSGHATWYREIVPAMVPPLLLSLTIFLSLSLWRTHLSHQLSLAESTSRISQLEDELAQLQGESKRTRERERRERERILPIVVGKVLQRVGVLGAEREDGDDESEEETGRLLV